MTPQILSELLNRVKHEELGLVIETNNPTYLHQMLIDLNTDRSIIIALPSLPNTVFIVKRTVDLERLPS